MDVFQRGNADRYRSRPSIGVITTVGSYERFVPEWAASVLALREPPDRVVVAAHDVAAVTGGLGDLNAEVIEVTQPFQFGTYLNHAVSHCDTDWIAWIGVDDTYEPDALNGLRELDADVAVFQMPLGNGVVWAGGDPQACLTYNPVPCGAPFKRWIWEDTPFDPLIAPFEDWAFWIGAVAAGARFARLPQIGFQYRRHEEQIVPEQESNAQRVREWALRLMIDRAGRRL